MESENKQSSGFEVVTVQQHIIEQQETWHPEAKGILTWVLGGITLATKMIQARVRRAGLLDVFGAAGGENPHGEAQQKLDVFANEVLLHCLARRDAVAVLVSEENDKPVTFPRGLNTGRYVVIFDPLDGSSNIDVNVGVGTIFSIYRRPDEPEIDVDGAVLQPGHQQVAAGYVVYGPSSVFVYTAGRGVFAFTLDPNIGAYTLSGSNLMMPDQGPYYSANEANMPSYPPEYREYIKRLRGGLNGQQYNSRYIGSLVADFHRTLLKGGVFLYPPTAQYPNGKLRLLYEANPLAFIAEQAGGKALAGTQRIMDIQPKNIHQRTSLVMGSRAEMEEFERVYAEVRKAETVGS